MNELPLIPNHGSTRYILRFNRGAYEDSYLSSFQPNGWTFTVTDTASLACSFNSQTQAICTAFCLLIDQGVDVVAIKDEEDLR